MIFSLQIYLIKIIKIIKTNIMIINLGNKIKHKKIKIEIKFIPLVIISVLHINLKLGLLQTMLGLLQKKKIIFLKKIFLLQKLKEGNKVIILNQHN